MSDTPSDAADHSDSNSPRASSVVACVLGGLGAYVGVFAILFLDEVVLRTRLVINLLPDSLHVPVRIFFYPLLLICDWLGWLPGGMPPVR